MSTVIDPVTGQPVVVQVVSPGTPDDPFAPKDGAGTQTAAASQTEPGQAPAAPATQAAPETPTATPEATPAAQAPAPPAAPAPVGMTEEQVQKMLDDKLREQRAETDRTITRLSQERDAERQRVAEIERQSLEYQRQHKLGDPSLTPEEKARLQQQFELEDRSRELNAWQEDLESYHTTLTVTSLVHEFGQYGVTAEALAQFESPEEMEAFALEAKANHLETLVRNGPTSTPAPAATAAPAAPPPPAPPGAAQPSDVGGGGTVHTPPAFREDSGGDALAANLKAAKWENVPIPY